MVLEVLEAVAEAVIDVMAAKCKTPRQLVIAFFSILVFIGFVVMICSLTVGPALGILGWCILGGIEVAFCAIILVTIWRT